MPREILCPRKMFELHASKQALAMMEEFVGRIQKVSRVQATNFKIHEGWDSWVSEPSTKSIYDYLNTVSDPFGVV